MLLLGAACLALWVAVPSVVLGLVVFSLLGGGIGPECPAPIPHPRGAVGGRHWSPEQAANAQLITTTVIQRGLPRRAAVLAIATAIAESGLHNLRGGDRDSLGLFQQRPSQGWGPATQILNPTTATNRFLTHLLTVPQWAALPAGVAEQTVQQSAHPAAYAPAEAFATHLVEHYWPNEHSATSPVPSGNPPTQPVAADPPRCPDQQPNLAPVTPPRPTSADAELAADPSARTAATTAVGFALAQVGKPYAWGAHGPQAFDCSGLVEAAWAAAGVSIGRTTLTQIHDGHPITDLHQIQPGDLLFIPGDEGTPAQPRHVGLATGDGWVIDAYDDSHGIIIEPFTRWAPKIAAIRRITPTHPPPQPPAALSPVGRR